MGMTVAALAARENCSAIDVTGTPAEINRGGNAVLRAYETDALVFVRIAPSRRYISATRRSCFAWRGRTHRCVLSRCAIN